MRRDIEFRTEDGVVLRGWHYVQERAGRTPTVVMAHGYSAVKEMYLDRFRRSFCRGRHRRGGIRQPQLRR